MIHYIDCDNVNPCTYLDDVRHVLDVDAPSSSIRAYHDASRLLLHAAQGLGALAHGPVLVVHHMSVVSKGSSGSSHVLLKWFIMVHPHIKIMHVVSGPHAQPEERKRNTT